VTGFTAIQQLFVRERCHFAFVAATTASAQEDRADQGEETEKNERFVCLQCFLYLVMTEPRVNRGSG
jgi:hypothetical protein